MSLEEDYLMKRSAEYDKRLSAIESQLGIKREPERGEQSSPGDSFSTSSEKRESSGTRSDSKSQSRARNVESH